MNVGTRLKQQRINAGLEIKEVAHRIGKSYQYVRQIEEGINDPPTWALLRDFANLYNCSIDTILGLDGMSGEIENFDELVNDLLIAIRKLPKYRQHDLLAVAELFLKNKARDDTLAMRIVLEKVNELGGQQAEDLLLDLLRGLGFDSQDGIGPSSED